MDNDHDFDRKIKENLDSLKVVREQVSPMDQARFDEAWDEMYSVVKTYLQKLGAADLGHIDAARPWYENLAEAVILHESNQPLQSGEDFIYAMERISESVRNLPDPENS